jgi:hypothetical protein
VGGEESASRLSSWGSLAPSPPESPSSATRCQPLPESFFVNAELPTPDLQERLRRYAKAGLRLEAPLRFLSTDLAQRDLPSLGSPEGQAVIEERLDSSIKLLVLNAVNTLCSAVGPSDDAATWNALETWLHKLRRRGVSVPLVHHDDPGQRRSRRDAEEPFSQRSPDSG